jgi:hypothetical protein
MLRFPAEGANVKRSLKFGGLIAVALILSSSALMATDRYDFMIVVVPDVELGEMYDKSEIFQPALAPVNKPLGGPAETGAKAGSSFSLGSGEVPQSGSAIVAPRGGSVYTPKQRADREIKKLIRKLS